MNKKAIVLMVGFVLLSLAGCGRENTSSEGETNTTETESAQADTNDENAEADNGEEDTEMKMQIEAGGSTFTATLEDNEAAAALVEMMEEEPVVIEMDDYSGFEKVGSLGTSLPASNRQMTTQAGDIVLYNGSQIVMFYGSNSWSYTKLAEVDDLTGWEDALGSGSVTVTLSVE